LTQQRRDPRAQPCRINKLTSGQKVCVPSQVGILGLAASHIESIAKAFGVEYVDMKSARKGITDVFEKVNDICFNTLYKSTSGLVHDQFGYQEIFATDIGSDPFRLNEQDADKLKETMRVAHLHIFLDRSATPPALAVWFNGTSNLRDVAENVRTMVGTYGPVYRAAKDAAATISRLLDRGDLRCDVVGGHSLGGGTAQCFAAALDVEKPPAMVLFDPQLLNDSQAAFAVEGGKQYDFTRLRGVAITLYSDVKPRKGLMDIMKAMARYIYPGLVELKLETLGGDVSSQNASAAVANQASIAPRPKPSLLLGYHKQPQLFEMAIHRFLHNGAAAEPPVAATAGTSSAGDPGAANVSECESYFPASTPAAPAPPDS
jgi:hypothetical protein